MGKKKRWLTALLTGCMAAALLTGCGGGGQSAGDKTTLKVGVTNFADTLEPTENYFSWVVMRYGMGETLVKFDEKMNATPWLAESWKISDDKLTWTFKIRDNVKFSNGKPLTAEAVKASLERSFKKNNRAETFFKYTEMKADGQTLTIKTEKPSPSMPGFLADPLFLIVDVSSEGERDFAKQGPICTGPYVCESFVTTDDGSYGRKGFVTTLLPDLLRAGDYDGVAVCGPPVMMERVAAITAEHGIPCEVSLEKRMACGLGACLSCAVDTRSGRRKVCKDGPVFAAGEVYYAS